VFLPSLYRKERRKEGPKVMKESHEGRKEGRKKERKEGCKGRKE
jgi:hypothetical protein